MAYAPEILIFDLHGRSVEDRADPYPGDVQYPSGESGRSDEAVRMLNAEAESIARRLEDEIAAILPPDPTLAVRAELRFRKGSVILAGTVALMSWAGAIVLDAAKAELADLVRIAIQRVMAERMRMLAPPGLPPLVMACSATPRNRAATPAAPAAAAASVATAGPGWRDILLAALALAVLALFADRYIDLKQAAPAPAPPAPAAR